MSEPQRKPFGHGKGPPAAAAKPAVKKAPPPPPAFEVVEDAPDFEVVEEEADFEVVEDAPKPKQAKRAEPSVPPRKKAARAEESGEDDAPARKKKKKKPLDDLSRQLLAKQDEDEARRAASLKHFEWTIPSVLFAIGFILSMIAAMAAAKGVSGVYAFTVLCVFVCIYVPLAIGALMVVGLVMGINYGRVGPAILKMAAITFIVNAIWLTGDWLRLPIFLIAPISCFISYGLFMTQFDLDTSETGASTGALNLMTFAANLVLIGFLVVAESSVKDKGGNTEPDGDDPPVERKERKRDKRPQTPDTPPVMEDNDDD